MYFCGDVIILDPINLTKSEEDWQMILSDTYDKVELEKIGIHQYLSFESCGEGRGQLVTDDHIRLGEFCTDSGMFCILLFEDLLKYKPDFDDHIEWPNSCAIIQSFEGEVTYEITDDELSVSGNGNVLFQVEWI